MRQASQHPIPCLSNRSHKLPAANGRDRHVLSITANAGLYTLGLPPDAESREKGIKYTHLITSSENVWIGAGTTLLSLRIGAAGSLLWREFHSSDEDDCRARCPWLLVP